MYKLLNTVSGAKGLLSAEHIAVVLCCLVVVIFFSMYFCRRDFKKQRIFVAICTLLLVAFEVVRIIFRCRYLESIDERVTFLSATGIDGFVLSLWISILLLIFAVIEKRKPETKTFGLNFIFSISSLFAIATTIYPVGLLEDLPVYDIINLTYYLSRTFVIMLTMTLALSGWISVKKFLDMWRGVGGIVIFGVICFVVSYFAFPGENIFYVYNCPLFVSLGINLPFPFHYILLGAFLFVGQMVMFLPFIIYNTLRYGEE